MNIQELCLHTYSRWTGRAVICAVCSKEVGDTEPPYAETIFPTEWYLDWVLKKQEGTVNSTFTIAPRVYYNIDGEVFP